MNQVGKKVPDRTRSQDRQNWVLVQPLNPLSFFPAILTILIGLTGATPALRQPFSISPGQLRV
jgi:hypothetical protein